jgi:hypothetical protein
MRERKIVFKWVLKRFGVSVWTGFIRLWIESSGKPSGSLGHDECVDEFLPFTFQREFSFMCVRDKVKEDEMGTPCSMNRRKKECL